MSMIRITGVVLLAATTLVAAPVEPPDSTSGADGRRTMARRALAGGDRAGARRLFLEALSLAPRATDLMAEVAGIEDPGLETAALWAHVAAVRHGSGRFALHGQWPTLHRDDLAAASEFARQTERAHRAVVSAVKRLSGSTDGHLVRYLASLGRALRVSTPAEVAALESAVDAAVARCRADRDLVVRELRDLARAAVGAGDDATAVAAARILVGLGQQADRTAGARAAGDGDARGILARARERLRAAETVHTVESLGAMTREEARAFGAEHDDWGRPGVARSPEGLYRLETVCGQRTLLVATEEIEFQHRRLVRWFGTDPFTGRPGTVRLCRSRGDFEREGAPFWWAGGFQGGDLTGIIVNFTEGNSLARTLTHELTHRFDGTLHPGMPAWLVEGRAVYAEVCTPSSRAPELDERLLSAGRIGRTGDRGFGRATRLETLVRGTVDDYRDNYDAGYTLWLFLVRFAGFEAGEDEPVPTFAARLSDYMKSFATSRRLDPIRRLESFFADGKDGRPDGFEAFAKAFERFLAEWRQEEPPEWRVQWSREDQQARRLARRARPLPILDTRTWPRDRRNFEAPEYGERQAGPAGVILAANGRDAAAREAFAWATEVDEPVGAWLATAADLHEKAGRKPTAFALRMSAARTDPARNARPAGPPGGSLAAPARAVAALADTLADLEAKERQAERFRLARAHRSDHDRLAALLGTNPLPAAPVPPALASGPPDCLPFRSLIEADPVGDRWSSERCGAKGPWHVPAPGTLVLGRAKPEAARSGRIREAPTRRVFARTVEVHEGDYTVRARIRLLTSVFDVFVVLGHTRHDRGCVIRLGGGDWMYQVGRRREASPLDGVRVTVTDLRPFDPNASLLAEVAPVVPPRDEFELTLRVSGPLVRVLVDGHLVLSHRRSTGDPVEGHVGFGLTQGVVEVIDPEVRHHRTIGDDRLDPCGDLDAAVRFDRPVAFPLATAVGRRVIGIPTSPGGTLLLWYADWSAVEGDAASIVRRAIEHARRRFEQYDLPIAVAVALPPGARREEDVPVAAELGLPPGCLVVHRGHSGPPWGGGPSWLLLDDAGVIRCGGPGFIGEPAFSLVHRLVGW